MSSRRYTIVWVDTHGRPIRRLKLRPWHLRLALATGLTAVGGVVAGLLGLVALVPQASARPPLPPIATLARRVAQLEAQMGPLGDQAARNAAAFAQVWSRSASAHLAPSVADLREAAPLNQMQDGRLSPTAERSISPSSGRRAAAAYDLDLLTLSEARLQRITQHGEALFVSLMHTLDHFHDAAQQIASTPSIRPSLSPWLSSSYGRRLDPITQRWMMHKGLDLAGSIGMPIFAPADGKVIWTGWRGGYGKTVVIDHGYGLQTHFAHLDAYHVDAGERVRRGDVIARMGNSGRSTGPHLHYEVRREGQPVDPRDFILD